MSHRVCFAQVPVKEILGRLVRNPGYNDQTVSLNGWCWIPAAAASHRKPLFQAALKDSIAREGIRNPILVYALEEGCFVSFGTSRLRAARDLELETIPAIVNDYAGRFPDAPEVTEDNHREFFKDVPPVFEITEHGADFHYYMERNRRKLDDAEFEAGLAWTDKDAEFVKKEFPWLTNAGPNGS